MGGGARAAAIELAHGLGETVRYCVVFCDALEQWRIHARQTTGLALRALDWGCLSSEEQPQGAWGRDGRGCAVCRRGLEPRGGRVGNGLLRQLGPVMGNDNRHSDNGDERLLKACRDGR